jgi:DNA-binding Xre family transcriptional regulator
MEVHVALKMDTDMIRHLMVDRGIESQAELARKANMSQVTLVSILKGGAFTLESLEKLAGALAVNPLDLLIAEGYPAPQPSAQAPGVPA